MSYVRNSVLRQRGETRSIRYRNVLAATRRRLGEERKVATNLIETLGNVRSAVAVNVPNGTTRKIARLVSVEA